MQSRHHESRDVRDVRQQQRADRARDLAHALEIDDTWIGAGADRDHPGPEFLRRDRELVVIDLLVALANAVMDDLKKPA